MVVTVVMVTAIVMVGACTYAPGKRGPYWRYSNTEGASAASRHRLARKQGLQGLRFAPGSVGKRAESPVSARLCGMAATRKVRTFVRTRLAGLHPGETKNGQDRKLNAGAGLQPARWLGCRNRPTSLCARSDASDTAPRNYLYACACACLTESYDNLCPMRQTRRGIRLASRNWTPPGGRSHHPVHPLAGFVVRQHHVQAKFLAQHPGNGSAHGVLLPAGVQHQLETGRALRVA